MESEIKDLKEDIRKLALDIALIKNAFLNEGELTEWALKELKEARKIPESECTSHEDVKRMILEKGVITLSGNRNHLNS